MAALQRFSDGMAFFDDGSALAVPEQYDVFFKGHYRLMPRPGLFSPGQKRRVGALPEYARKEAVAELFAYLRGEID